MYNAAWKTEYLRYTNNSNNSINMINYVERFEESAGYDVYDMTPNEIIMIVSSCNTAAFAEKLKTEINRYLEYCRARNKIIVNVVKVISSEDWKKIIKERKQAYYLSDDKYHSFLERIRLSDGGCYDAAIFSSIYNNIAGIKYFNLVHLRLSDINMEIGSVKLKDGRIKVVENNVITLLTEASRVFELQGDSYMVKLPYSLFSDSIWRVAKEPSETAVSRRFISRLEKIKSLLDESDMTYNGICNSGIFNRIVKSTEAAGLNIKEDFDKLYANSVAEKYLPYFKHEDIENIKQFKDRCGNYIKFI